MFRVESPQRVIAVVGKPAAGKTTIMHRLSPMLCWPVMSIDSYRAQGKDWPHLVRDVARLRQPTFVESCLIPPEYRQVLARHSTAVVEVICDPQVRKERMKDRPYSGHEDWKVRYDGWPHEVVDTTEGWLSTEQVTALARWCEHAQAVGNHGVP